MSAFLNLNNFNAHINVDFATVQRIPIINFMERGTFVKFIEILKNVIAGEDCYSITLTDDGKVVNFCKSAFLCIDLFNININDKRFINAINTELTTKIKTDPELQQEFADVSASLEQYFEKITELAPVPLDYEDPTVTSFLKLMNAKIPVDELSFFEKLFSYIDLTSKVIPQPIIFFVNLPTFLSKEEMAKLYETAVMKGVHIISLEFNACEIPDDDSVIEVAPKDNFYSII